MDIRRVIRTAGQTPTCPCLGITGTGGAGKALMVDELVRRFLIDFADKRMALSRGPFQAQRRAAPCSAIAFE